MSDTVYDVVIAGAGVAGAIMAKHCTDRGLKVLLLEAGPGTPQSLSGYDAHVQRFYAATAKGPESAWPGSINAPQPDTADLKMGNGYFVQNGPHLYGSSYSRTQGGSTLHWLGVSLRMVPEDFQMQTRHGVGRDWPIGYDDLEAWYRQAELDMGVSADVADQAYQGINFASGYDYPMQRVPLSYSDQWLEQHIGGLEVTVGNTTVPVHIRSYPAARNSMPRGDYQPVGAMDRRADGQSFEPHMGERCQGNTSCTPICPVQAKYNAGRTIGQIPAEQMTVLARAVASKIEVDSATGQVTGIAYKRYDDGSMETHIARGRRYVLAAHAVENAKIMLASGLKSSSGLVGRNLMDHPTIYAWGLAPEPVGPFRGPLSTAGMEDLRSGSHRAQHAAFRFDVGNDGWKAPVGAPDANVAQAVLNQKLCGNALRQHLAETISRQVRFSLAIEQLPDPSNRVELDYRFPDPLGNPRPAIHYRIDDYTLAGMVEADRVARAMFAKAGIEDHTDSSFRKWFPTAEYQGRSFAYHGMGHFAGTHLMGADATTSVVDANQRSWDHHNLYLIGSGSMPTMGTSNPTLTIAALAARSAEHLVSSLADR